MIELGTKIYESADELKGRLGVSEVTLHRYIKKGALPRPIKIAKRRYFDREEVDLRVLQWT